MVSGEKRQFMMDKTGEEVKNYKSLLVWKKSMELVKKVYELTNTFPEIEKFGLFIKHGGLQFQFLLILPKVRPGTVQRNL